MFIINPVANKVKGKLDYIADSIDFFFQKYPQMRYDVHVTRWERDALCVIRQHARAADELLRVHVMGGSGTLFEAVNALYAQPNTQLAVYPYGFENTLLHYFGADKLHMFSSIHSQIFSDTAPIDVIRCGEKYFVSHGMMGLEAACANMLREMRIVKSSHYQLFYLSIVFFRNFFSNMMDGQNYKIELDGHRLDGRYLSILAANSSCYGYKMCPAVDAHPNNGMIDLYLIRPVPRLKFVSSISKYFRGNYRKIPDSISHYRGTKLTVSSDAQIAANIDYNRIYTNKLEFEVLPYAIDLVCPAGVGFKWSEEDVPF